MDKELKKMLEEILNAVNGLDSRVTHLEVGQSSTDGLASSEVASTKKMSIKEFIIDRAPTNGVQTTLTVSYYLEMYDGISPINAVDLENGFRAAKVTVPNNINDKANMCVSNGHLMEAKEKKDSMKAWVVTGSGEQVVQKGFRKS